MTQTPHDREVAAWLGAQREHIKQLRDEVRSRLREAQSTLKIAELLRLQLKAAVEGLAAAIKDRSPRRPRNRKQ